MSYLPLQNEVVITGLNIVSGGTTWAGVTVAIPVSAPGGNPITPAEFYVKSAADGSLIKVDLATAEQLYASSVAINDLNSFYDKLGAQYTPSQDWVPVVNSVKNVLNLESLSSLLASSIPDLLDPELTAASIIGGASTLVSAASSFGKNDAELALANSVLGNAENLLNTSYTDYQKYIYDYMPHPADGLTSSAFDQPIAFSAVQNTLYNTFLSLNAGNAATQALSDVANLNGSVWDDLFAFAKDAGVSVLESLLEAISPLASSIEAPIHTAFDILDDRIDVNTFATSLQGLIAAAQTAALTSSPFSPGALNNDGVNLASSIAVTQGIVLGQTGGSNTVAPTPSFTIVSSPTVSENAGQLVFTINETGILSQNLTVYLSTVQNVNGSGVYNTAAPGSTISTDYYYHGLNSLPITFAATSASSSSQPISIAINPVGLTSGSETFGFIVQEKNSSGTFYTVASTPFTIVNQSSSTSGPTISSVTPPLGSGSVVTAGRSLTFTVSFSAPVTVNLAGGPPFLTLNDNETASYTGGSGTNALTFVYNVNPGDETSNLQVTGLAIPNGSRIADLAGNAAITSGASTSTGIQINTSAPTVTITSTGGLVGSAVQTISGTVDVADVGSTVTVFDGANNIGTATVAADGTWTTTVTLSVSGANTVVAKDTNSAGNTGVSNQVFYTLDTASYSLSPTNPTALENQGSLVFTISRFNDTSAENVFVQTADNQGSANPNNAYFNEQNLVPVFFPQYAQTATFAIAINDIHATSGSQTFGVSIYPGLSTSGGSLASTTFTINDTDTNTGPLTGSIITNDTVTGTTTVSTAVFVGNNATLQNNGVIDINVGGSLFGDNAGGILTNSAGSVINIDTSDGSGPTIDLTRLNNSGTIIAAPGSGKLATIWMTNGGIGASGAIQVLSGTLQLHMFGAGSSATLNASGISVDPSAALKFTGAGTFSISGGNYSNGGTTIVGDTTYIGQVVFGAGTTVNLGGNWQLNAGSVDFSAATLLGTFSTLALGDSFNSLDFGSKNISINNFSSFLSNIFDSGTVTLSGSIVSDASWLGGGTLVNNGTISPPSGGQPGLLGSNETLINNGTIIGGLIFGSKDIVNNLAGGILDLTINEIGSGAVINNAGLINFVGTGSGNGQVPGQFNNTGTAEFLNASGWNLSGGGSSNASNLLIANGVTLFIGGNAATATYSITGGAFTGGGNLWVVSGAKAKFSASTEVDIPFHNDATIEVAGGTLTLEQPLTGSGTVAMDPGTTLALAAPNGFTDSISGFATGDSIDLLGTAATDVSLNGSNQLVVKDAGLTVGTLQLIGNYPGNGLQFLLASDGKGGTSIKLGVPSAPSVSAGAIVPFVDISTPTAITLDSTLAVIGGGSAALLNASIVISSGFQSGDLLAATTAGTNIAAGYNPSTGVLSLSGTDTLANYQSVLQSATFNSTSNAQNNGADPLRTITWTVSDGTRISAPATSSVLVADAAPIITTQANLIYTVGSSPVALASDLSLSDIDSTTVSGATVAIAFGFTTGDALGVTTTGTSISVASNTGGSLALTGTDSLANYQAVLRSATFSTTDISQNTRIILWTVNDGIRASTLAASTVTTDETVTTPQPPVVTVTSANVSASHNQPIAASGLFSASDPDGDTITQYLLYQQSSGVGSGHLVVNGVAQAAQTLIYLTPTQLAQATFQAGFGTSDDLFIKAYDGLTWSSWGETHVTTPADQPPVVTVTSANVSASHNQMIAASNLFSASDPDGDTITQNLVYQQSSGIGSGHFLVNGVAQAAQTLIYLTPTQLAQTTFQAGVGTSDDLFIKAYDGLTWSSWGETHVTSPADQPPVVTVTSANVSASHNQTIAASGLISASDPDGDTITQYLLYQQSSGVGSGHFVVNGIAQAAQTLIYLTPAQLAQTTFQAGVGVSDDLFIKAYDGSTWSSWGETHVTSPADQPPAVTVTSANVSASHNQTIAASGLFSASDPDGDTITQYLLYQQSSGVGSGHFVVDGVAQAAQTLIYLTPTQLAQTTFQAGVGVSDDLFIKASDGSTWSSWGETHVTTPADQPPMVTDSDLFMITGQAVAASSLFSASDPDGDTITQYLLYQQSSGVGSGHFVVNGVAQAAQTLIYLTPTQLAQTAFQAGTSATDDLFIKAYDGFSWSSWGEMHATPTGSGTSAVVAAGATLDIGSSYSGTVTFAGSTGMLKLANSKSFTGTIGGQLAIGDVVDLADITAGANATIGYSGNNSPGALTVSDGTHTASIALLGNYSLANFTASSDAHGGTSVVDPPLDGTLSASLSIDPAGPAGSAPPTANVALMVNYMASAFPARDFGQSDPLSTMPGSFAQPVQLTHPQHS